MFFEKAGIVITLLIPTVKYACFFVTPIPSATEQFISDPLQCLVRPRLRPRMSALNTIRRVFFVFARQPH